MELDVHQMKKKSWFALLFSVKYIQAEVWLKLKKIEFQHDSSMPLRPVALKFCLPWESLLLLFWWLSWQTTYWWLISTCLEGESTCPRWLEGTFLEPWYCDPNWIFFSTCCALVQLNLLTLDLWYMVHKKWCGMTQKYNYSESLHWFQVFHKTLGFPGLKKILWKFLFSWVLEN